MMPEISFSIDPDDNEFLSIYLRLSEDQVVRTVELGPECNLDLDERGEVVGAELLAPCDVNIIYQAAEKYHAPMLKRIAPHAEKLCRGA
jgi:uncharacterized protein YuzE